MDGSFTEWQLNSIMRSMQRDVSTSSFFKQILKASLLTLAVVGLLAGTWKLGKIVTDPSRLKTPTSSTEMSK